MSIELMMPSSHLILCHPLLLLPSVFPSIRFCSSVSVVCIRWPNYWRFSISPSNEYLGLISFRIDWFDLLAVQGTFNSLLQHHSVKASKCFLLQSGNMLVKKFKYIQHGYPRRSLSQALSGVWEHRALPCDVQSLPTMLEVKPGIASAPAYSYSFSESYGQWLRRQTIQETSKKKKFWLPSQVPPAQPRAGCQDCTSWTPS